MTTIVLEHTEILGKTHGAIAAEKAGIVKPGCDLVSGCDPASEEGEVLRKVAVDQRVRQHRVAYDPGDSTFDARNQRVARAALDALRERGVADAGLTEEVVEAARLPGRMELREFEGVPVLLDGAHVAQSMEMAVNQARLEHPGPMWVVLAVHKEKDVERLTEPLIEAEPHGVICCSITDSRVHFEATKLLEKLSGSRAGVAGRAIEDPQDALREACAAAKAEPGGWVFVTGSLYVVGAVRPLVWQRS